MGSQHRYRKQDNGIQPHDIPIVASHKSAECIEQAEENDGHIVFLKTLAQVPGEGHSAQRGLESDQQHNCFAEAFPGKEQNQKIQGGGSVIGGLNQKVFSESCGPAVKQTLSLQ